MTEATNTTTTTKPIGRPRGNGEKAKRVSKITPGESRADKFTRLALARIPKAKKAMRMITNLAKYPYSEAQRAKLIGEINRMAAEVEAAFKPKGRSSDSFTF